jgi:hypothetical protein
MRKNFHIRRFVFLLIFIHAILASAQQPFNRVYRSDPGNTLGTIFSGVLATDSAFYITGLTVDTVPYNHNVGLFAKFDLDGSVLIQKTFGDTVRNLGVWRPLLEVGEDGNLLTLSLNTNRESISLIKLNPEGDTLRTNAYCPSTPGNLLLTGNHLEKMDDGGWVFPFSEYDISIQDHQAAILITDSSGSERNRFFYGQLGSPEFAMDIISESGGGFTTLVILSDRDVSSIHNARTKVVRMNPSGGVELEYETSLSRFILCGSMVRTDAGDYVIAGAIITDDVTALGSHRYRYRGYLAKLNSNLQLIWERIAGDSAYFDASYWNVAVRGDRIYAVGDYALPMVGGGRGWLTAYTLDGTLLFERLFTNPGFPDFTIRRLRDLDFTSDGGLIMCSDIEVGTFGPYLGNWGWLIKTDSLGNAPFSSTVGIGDDLPAAAPALALYPNPAREEITVAFPGILRHPAEIRVWDSGGRLVRELKAPPGTGRLTIDLTGLSPGVYFVQAESGGGLMSGKFVVGK